MEKIKKFIKKEKKYFISISLLMFIQMFLYMTLKYFQTNPIYINSYLDDYIPFIGYFVYIYDLFYPFCFVALYFLYKKDEKSYFKGVISGIIGYIICNIIFIFMPTIMFRPPIPSYDFLTNLVIKITFYFDEPPLNCFPSIHCLFCFQVIYSYLISKYPLKGKIIAVTCALLIILSTLFIKQHFVLDVISALLVCLIANLITNISKLYTFFKKKKII